MQVIPLLLLSVCCGGSTHRQRSCRLPARQAAASRPAGGLHVLPPHRTSACSNPTISTALQAVVKRYVDKDLTALDRFPDGSQ